MSKKNKNNSIFVAVLVLVFAAYTIACGYLFYMQAARAEGQYFESDLPAHLSMAKDGWGYSLTAVFYRLFMLLPGYEILVAAFLALFAGGTMVATYFGIRKFIGNRWSALGASVAANIVMPCFMKAVHYERYIGYQSPSVWHNSTYTVMKCLALLTLIFYLRFAHGYKKKIQWRDWILFTFFLTLSTATKTSFLLVFAPVAFAGLIVDLIRKVPVGRVLLFASAIIPSIAVVLLQEAVLFGCAIITGKRGASGFHGDVPIPDEYKFGDPVSQIDEIVAKIRYVLDNYENVYSDFDEYRETVLNLEDTDCYTVAER